MCCARLILFVFTVSNGDTRISATNVTFEKLTSEWLMVWARRKREQLYTDWGR